MKFYLAYFQFVLISIILIGCGDVPNENDNSTSSQNLSRSNLSISSQAISFISNHENVLGYGAVNLSAIINNGYYKTDLNNLSFLDYDRLKDSINNQRIWQGMAPISRDEFNAKIDPIRNIFNQFEGKFIHHININEPIYFLCIGENVNDFEFIIFGVFNDREGFLKELKTNEYIDGDLKSKIFRDYKGLKIHHDRDWAFAFSNDKFVFSSNDNNPISLSQFEKHFNAFQGAKNSSVNLSLHDNQIFNIDFDLGKIVRLGFNSLSINEKEEFQDFYNRVKGFIDWKGNIEFWIKKGQISLNWRFFDNNEWHDILKNESSGILKYLSAGKGVSGFLANLNISGIQQLFYDEFPGGLKELSESISSKEEFSFRVPYEIRFLEKLILANGFDKFFDGELGYMFFDPIDIDDSLALPAEMSLYSGIGNDFKEFIKTQIDMNKVNEKLSSDFNPIFSNPLELNLQRKGLSLSSSNHKFDGIGPDLNKKLDYFGRKPITAFIDFKTIIENSELRKAPYLLKFGVLPKLFLLDLEMSDANIVLTMKYLIMHSSRLI